jgi:S-DNA-T family DNA segregation ATPase FtsK/SpoIIIE
MDFTTVFNRAPRSWVLLPADKVQVPPPPSYPSAAYNQGVLWTILPSLMMVLMSAGLFLSRTSTGGVGEWLSIGFLAMSLLYPVMMIVNHRREVKRIAEETDRLKREFAEDVRATVDELAELQKHQAHGMHELFPAAGVLLHRARERHARLWERRPADHDFLCLRFGLGAVPATYQIVFQATQSRREEDKLFANSKCAPYGLVPDAPLTIRVPEVGSFGIAGPLAARSALARTLLVNVAAHHQPNEVRVFFVRDARIKPVSWGWLKWLPHVRADYRTLAASPATIREMLQGPLDELRRRELALSGEAGARSASLGWPYLLFVVENPALVEGHAALETILRAGRQIRAGAIYLTDHVQRIPDGCGAKLEVSERSVTLTVDQPGCAPCVGAPEFTDPALCAALARSLAPLQIAAEGDLPTSLRLSTLLGAGARCQLDLPQLWRAYADPSRQLTAPIGIGLADAVVTFDLHNNVHGPHGLIAGTTGAGKTVLLSTLLASLAACNDPRLVNFVIIDMKGDPKLELLRDLPHTVGFASALPTGVLKTKNHIRNYIERAVKALENEISQRMQRLNAANIQGDLFDYNARFPDDPIPHLVVIVDEFAVLKREFPELMAALIDVAATGRQPGVHLILCTQSPSGVIDDKIWANSQFRLVLRVANRAESQSILRRPDAASLPAKPPGRAYLQVGGDPDIPLEKLQVASAGFPIQGDDPGAETYDAFEIVELLSDGTRERLYPAPGDARPTPTTHSELQQIVYLADKAARDLAIPLPLPGPWLPPLPDVLPFDALWAEFRPRRLWTREGWTEADDTSWLRLPFGRMDEPTVRRQPVWILDLGQHDHVWIAGQPGAGHDLALRTLVKGLVLQHTPDELQLYALAFAGQALAPFKALPHLRGFFSLSEGDALKRLIVRLMAEAERRQGLLRDAGVDTAAHYRAKTGLPLPAIVIALDGFDVLYREAQLAAYNSPLNDVRDGIEKLLRAGCDIHLVLSSISATLFRDNFEKQVTGRIALATQQPGDVTSILGVRAPISIDFNRGRALIAQNKTVAEVQLVAPTAAVDLAAETDSLAALAEAMAAVWAPIAAARPPVPDEQAVTAGMGTQRPLNPLFDLASRSHDREAFANQPRLTPKIGREGDAFSWLPDEVEEVTVVDKNGASRVVRRGKRSLAPPTPDLESVAASARRMVASLYRQPGQPTPDPALPDLRLPGQAVADDPTAQTVADDSDGLPEAWTPAMRAYFRQRMQVDAQAGPDLSAGVGSAVSTEPSPEREG